jgi:hypothetical protein
MAKCFDHIWSSSGQQTYKSVSILHSVLHITAKHSWNVQTNYTLMIKNFLTYDQTKLGSEVRVPTKRLQNDPERDRTCHIFNIYSGICYNERFLSIQSGQYNERWGILSADVVRACAWRVGPSHFDYSANHHCVIVCKVQLSVYFNYLLICTAYKS